VWFLFWTCFFLFEEDALNVWSFKMQETSLFSNPLVAPDRVISFSFFPWLVMAADSDG
jgi:hypothetical protein